MAPNSRGKTDGSTAGKRKSKLGRWLIMLVGLVVVVRRRAIDGRAVQAQSPGEQQRGAAHDPVHGVQSHSPSEDAPEGASDAS